jgi:Zn-dependent protease with chaperone function
MTARLFSYRYRALISALMLTAALGNASAQTVITPDKNKYSPADDVKIGLEAAQQARQELPMLNDSTVDNYIENIGGRLVAAIPSNLQHPNFRYTFDVVNMKEINAFALPGGPMFVNRGMIDAAKTEGEVAGVMAHEIAHVALRHGTAQATKGEKFQIGSVLGQILGAVVGGTAGSVISAGSQIGLGTYFMKYGREYERQADLLGAQIMARAGYDPRRMADMFQTIERQGTGGGPEWMSSHPNPGNRRAAIEKEAAMLRVTGNAENLTAFNSIKSRLTRMDPAYTAEQVARGQVNRGRNRGGDVPARTSRGRLVVEAPSNRYRTANVGNFMQVSVPDNWEEMQANNTVVLAPQGGYYESGNSSSFTHGLQVGVIRSETHSLEQGTDELVDSFRRSNPEMRMQGNYRRERLGGKNALTVNFTNMSAETGEREAIALSTMQLGDGSLLYMIGVAPDYELNRYNPAFQRARQTIRVNENALRYR